jgi:alkanesulfonate monooxygenase SsuD/methylene tetrahydromethanopterin reductase-like flavin-dependent oxidoreductase (luciferase family)
MRMGVLLPLFGDDASTPVERARTAQRLGFDGVFGFDHLLPLGGPPDGPALEVFSILAAVAAACDALAVGTLVARVTLRHPGLLAKQAAALDDMSGGRFVLGLGSGDQRSRVEAERFGFPLPGVRERRVLLEETAGACKALFAGRRWPGGDLVPAMDGPLLPPPASAAGPPVWLGGTSSGVIDAAGRVADGWNGWGLGEEAFRRKAERLASAAGAAGRRVEATWAGLALVAEDGPEIDRMLAQRRDRGLGIGDMWWGTAEDLAEFVSRLEAAGAAWVVLMLAGPADRIEVVGERCLPLLGRPA